MYTANSWESTNRVGPKKRRGAMGLRVGASFFLDFFFVSFLFHQGKRNENEINI